MDKSEFPYKIEIEWSQADKVYVARVPALKGCAAHGKTPGEAANQVMDGAVGIMETMEENGQSLPPMELSW